MATFPRYHQAETPQLQPIFPLLHCSNYMACNCCLVARFFYPEINHKMRLLLSLLFLLQLVKCASDYYKVLGVTKSADKVLLKYYNSRRMRAVALLITRIEWPHCLIAHSEQITYLFRFVIFTCSYSAIACSPLDHSNLHRSLSTERHQKGLQDT